ncbi:hypothetical protein HRbin33_02595 [bacterium HR33]|nr:hypothetical protein HRbin33_02595 [bacterium HR33]
MPDPWTDRLSEYLDGELSPEETAQLERHLPECENCRVLLGELRAVVERARALEASPPARDLWPGIAGRIGLAPAAGAGGGAGATRRGVFVSLPALAAGVAAIAVLSGVAVWKLAVPEPAGRDRPPAALVVAGTGGEAAISDLERILDSERGRLDSGTVRVLEESLQVIDQAIEEARRALAADPSSLYLNHHLAQTMRLKMDLLRRSVVLARARL